jgi:hypothetical protein
LEHCTTVKKETTRQEPDHFSLIIVRHPSLASRSNASTTSTRRQGPIANYKMLPPLDCPIGSFYINITGYASAFPTGYIPHGNKHLAGEGVFTFHDDSSMDWTMRLTPPPHPNQHRRQYEVTQAHIYNLPLVPEGDSWACWGGRWSKHEYMEGVNFDTLYGITAADIASDTWVIMLHTEGGHFAVDETGNLIVYDASVHETSVTGITEKGERFNNRVPRLLTNRYLREINTVSGKRGEKDFDAEFPDPNHFERTQDEPFPDANDNVWIAWDVATNKYIPSPYGASRNLTQTDIDTVEYLFYLYDDQGPEWDWGGPEGAGGGILIPCSERPAHPLPLPPQEHHHVVANATVPTASPAVVVLADNGGNIATTDAPDTTTAAARGDVTVTSASTMAAAGHLSLSWLSGSLLIVSLFLALV